MGLKELFDNFKKDISFQLSLYEEEFNTKQVRDEVKHHLLSIIDFYFDNYKEEENK